MPIHDWSRVSDGTFYDFHLAWIAALRDTLNNGLLPPDYYALAEQIAGPLGPDVLTLQAVQPNGVNSEDSDSTFTGSIALATAAPRVRFTAQSEMDDYVYKRRTLVIRHSSNDRIIALLEIVSPGNKASKNALRVFANKALEALYLGFHLLIVDLHAPTKRDPQGIHGVIWSEIEDDDYTAPSGKPLTLAAYSAGPIKRAFVEPVAVGDTLIDMPLFLEPELYVNVNMETTYQAAYHGVPTRWKRVLEAPGT
jgi:hypothetical protein